MQKKEYIVLGAMFSLLLFLVVLFFQTGVEKRKKPVPLVPVAIQDNEGVEQPELKTVKLFFLSEQDDLLHGEDRDIFPDPSLVFEMKQTIEELLKGSNNGLVSPFPPETKLREIFFSEDGIAYVDFSRDVQDLHISGVSAEVETVYSVVNSLAYNFQEVKRVFFLVDGNGKDTLKGHVDISRPLLPMYDLIVQ
jgi:spore germination protein GerM